MLGDTSFTDSEDDELGRKRSLIASPSATPKAGVRLPGPELGAGGSAQPGSTEDLENRGLASRIQPSPTLGQDTSALGQRRARDEARLTAAQESGPGISHLPTAARIPLRVLEGIGSALRPNVMSLIPGTTLHHNAELGGLRRNIGEDIGEQEKEALTGEATAKTGQAEAAAEKDRAAAEAARNPQPKPKEEKWSINPHFTDADGTPLLNEENSGQVIRASDRKPPTGYKAVAQPKTERPDAQEQQFVDEYQRLHPGATIAQAQHAYADNSQKPEREPRQMVIGPDGKVIELHPGDIVPQGSKTVTGDLTNKPTADEQRRADLSENLNENLAALEDIVTRRPELFGAVRGRITGLKGTLGSNDRDIGALETIKHQIGMAQISAHGMRSAYGIGAAAESILNSFKNGPDAVKASIEAARNSVKTFTADVNKTQNQGAQNKGGGGATEPIYAVNPKTKERVVSNDGGKTWQATK